MARARRGQEIWANAVEQLSAKGSGEMPAWRRVSVHLDEPAEAQLRELVDHFRRTVGLIAFVSEARVIRLAIAQLHKQICRTPQFRDGLPHPGEQSGQHQADESAPPPTPSVEVGHQHTPNDVKPARQRRSRKGGAA
jgi:hypothetical protein